MDFVHQSQYESGSCFCVLFALSHHTPPEIFCPLAASAKLKQISNSDELFASIGACMEKFPDNEVIVQCLISVVLTLGASSRGASPPTL